MTVGFFGKIPATGDFVTANLPRVFTDRWDRWMSKELSARPDEGELDTRNWRFIVHGGVFGEQPCAGAWRMSQDRVGRRYPLTIARLGPPPDTTDKWFDAVAALLEGAVVGYWDQSRLADKLAATPQPAQGPQTPRIVFWCDDWEVRELNFADIHDLADRALPAMRAARQETGAS
jgi:type VI secretion system protein ImpM